MRPDARSKVMSSTAVMSPNRFVIPTARIAARDAPSAPLAAVSPIGPPPAANSSGDEFYVGCPAVDDATGPRSRGFIGLRQCSNPEVPSPNAAVLVLPSVARLPAARARLGLLVPVDQDRARQPDAAGAHLGAARHRRGVPRHRRRSGPPGAAPDAADVR